MPGERLPRDLVEIEHLPNDLPDLVRWSAADSAIGSAVLRDGHEACDRRFDRLTRS